MMTALPRATDFPLQPPDADRLERLLAGEAERIRDGLTKESFSGPVCALAFIYVEEHDLPTASYVSAWTESARKAALNAAEESPAWALWYSADWDHDSFLGAPPAAVYKEAERVAAALQAAGCEDPEGAFVCDLAHRLSRADWSGVMEVTEDFACWATEHETDEDVFDTFRLTAPPAAVSAYTARGWLRFPEGFNEEALDDDEDFEGTARTLYGHALRNVVPP